MKIIYSEIKKILPGLKQDPKKLAEDLTLIGHFVDSIEKREGETIISLEVRQNRGDCLGYWGIAHDLAVLYQLKVKEADTNQPLIESSLGQLPIEIQAPDKVSRVMAVKISQIKNQPSPKWLKNFLALHDINSINTLVDLTNYIMIWWGLPNHAFDARQSSDQLIWRQNQGIMKNFTSLDGSQITLGGGVLQVDNGKEILSLAGIVGGRKSGVNLATKEVIVEMATYDPAQIRTDSRKLKITTEASSRLEKQLDPQLIPPAFNHLINLILANCQGKISSQIYCFSSSPAKKITIKFNPQSPAKIAGININSNFSRQTLIDLGCQISADSNQSWLVIPPSWRKDLELEEDLAEEVIRFWGYQKIPTNQAISRFLLPNITPKIIPTIETVKNILVNLGYDEVRSWSLIKKTNLAKAYFLPAEAEAVYTQNSINDHYPLLRMAMISSLATQNRQYQKLKIPQISFFEIGKIFYRVNSQFKETWSLGIFDQSEKNLAKKLKLFSLRLGLTDIINPPFNRLNGGIAVEINLDDLASRITTIPKAALKQPSQLNNQTTKELTKQIISLDTNLVLSQKKPIREIISHYQKKIAPQYLWQLVVMDIYPQGQGDYKYTLRAFYYNCSSAKAKKIHQEVFAAANKAA